MRKLLSLLLFAASSLTAQISPSAFTQIPSLTPVLAKGGVYGGWEADALAAPAAIQGCGSFSGEYVMTVSLWSIANSQWASAIFTSPDLQTWTYLANSLQAPQGSDYIIGNSGLVCFNGAFYWAYNHYPAAGNPVLTVATSTNLTSWTVTNSSVSGSTCTADPSLDLNPNGTLELWGVQGSSTNCSGTRTAVLFTSSDGATFTSQGVYYTFPAPTGTAPPGEPSVFYIGTTRYMTYDQSETSLLGRWTQMINSAGQNTTWTSPVTANLPNAAIAWQDVQVFDASVIVTDTGDGHGAIPHMVFAGGDTAAPTDNTDSSIGAATAIGFAGSTFKGSLNYLAGGNRTVPIPSYSHDTSCANVVAATTSTPCSVTGVTAGDAEIAIALVLPGGPALATSNPLVDSVNGPLTKSGVCTPASGTIPGFCVYELPNVSSGSHTITATWASTASLGYMYVEFVKGASITSPIDGFTYSQPSGITTSYCTGATFSPHTAGEYIWGALWNFNGYAYTTVTGNTTYTFLPGTYLSAPNSTFGSYYGIGVSTSPTAVTSNWTGSTSNSCLLSTVVIH